MKIVLIASLLFAQMVSTGGHRKIFPSSGGGSCPLPYTDSLSGTGPLNSCYAIASASGYSTLSRVSGAVVPAASSAGMAVLSGATFSSTQSSEMAVYAVSGGGATGPVVRGDASGNGYLWIVGIQQIIVLNGGAGGATVTNSCPPVANGDVVKLLGSGTTLTCLNVTSGVSGSGTDATYTSGSAGFLVDKRTSGSNTSINSFVAN